jgi:hypothetical protein
VGESRKAEGVRGGWGRRKDWERDLGNFGEQQIISRIKFIYQP